MGAITAISGISAALVGVVRSIVRRSSDSRNRNTSALIESARANATVVAWVSSLSGQLAAVQDRLVALDVRLGSLGAPTRPTPTAGRQRRLPTDAGGRDHQPEGRGPPRPRKKERPIQFGVLTGGSEVGGDTAGDDDDDDGG